MADIPKWLKEQIDAAKSILPGQAAKKLIKKTTKKMDTVLTGKDK